MQAADLIDAKKIAHLLFAITQTEGYSVEIHYANPDFGGPDSSVTFKSIYTVPGAETFEITRQGATVLECLFRIVSLETCPQCRENRPVIYHGFHRLIWAPCTSCERVLPGDRNYRQITFEEMVSRL